MKTRTTKTTRPAALLLASIPSASQPGVVYEVKQSQVDGNIYCSCPSWKYQRLAPKDRTCKHIRAYQSGILQTPRPAVVAPVPAPALVPQVAAPVTKEVNVTDLRKTIAYALKNGAKGADAFKLAKEGGLSDLAAWSLLAELDSK